MSTTIGRTAPGTDIALLYTVRLFLLLLVCSDLAYMALHAGHLTMPSLGAGHFSLEADRGVAEFHQYMKQLWLALCLAIASVRRRHLVLLVWSGFFAFLMLDDAMKLHENTGRWLGQHFGLPAGGGLRPDDFGEMLVAAAIGATLLVGLAVAWWRDRDATWRHSRELLVLTAALAFCAVVIDTAHTIAYFRMPEIAEALGSLEDGGELLVISALTAYGLDLAIRGTHAPVGLRRLLRGDPARPPRPTPAPAADGLPGAAIRRHVDDRELLWPS